MANIGGINISAESFSKLKVPVTIARDVTKGDGLDQIYVKGDDGKDYVASGVNLPIDKLKTGDNVTIAGKSGIVTFIDNEKTSFGEGSVSALKSTAGKSVAIGSAVVVGGLGTVASGLGSMRMWSTSNSFAPGSSFVKGALIGLAASVGITALVGGIKASLNSADYSKVKSITE